MKRYSKIESKFIKEKIKGAYWKRDRHYINDLIMIERIHMGTSFGWMVGYVNLALKDKYPKEYDILFKELDPKIYEWQKKREKREKEKDERQLKKLKIKVKEWEKAEKEDWIEAGGRI